MTFVEEIAADLGIPNDHLLVQYLKRKTKAADRGSKARRSLGNLYALYVLAEAYLESSSSRFSDLLGRMRQLPFGAKLQNHPLDNRLNDEFARQYGVADDLMPVRADSVGGQKARVISETLLSHGGVEPRASAKLIVTSVDRYVELITANQTGVLDDIADIDTWAKAREFFDVAFAATADARLFEVASYVLLAEYYRGQTVYVGESPESLESYPLRLYKTGRTNANDGGIDFVLQPLGRFFQVTETLEFRKYFLDFEKVNRYPFTFVIKIAAEPDAVLRQIIAYATRSGQYDQSQIESYEGLFEEIITLNSLRSMLDQIEEDRLPAMTAELSLQFKLEFGLLD